MIVLFNDIFLFFIIADEIIARFAAMRTTYFANKRRLKEAKNNGKRLIIKWAHFESLSFLDGAHSSQEGESSGVVDVNRSDDVAIKYNVWTIDEEEILISFYENHSDLWDHRSNDYKKIQKGQILDDLVTTFNSKFTRK